MADGLTRDELDMAWLDLTSWFSVFWPESERREEDVYQAQRFFYTDWPYIDDPIKNRDMYGKVSLLQVFLEVYLYLVL